MRLAWPPCFAGLSASSKTGQGCQRASIRKLGTVTVTVTVTVWRILLCIQEQIQGPKNAPIARFDGLRCY